jgi:hypothetical protein
VAQNVPNRCHVQRGLCNVAANFTGELDGELHLAHVTHE